MALAAGCTAMKETPSSAIPQSAAPGIDLAPAAATPAAPVQDVAVAQETPKPDAQASPAPAFPPSKPDQPPTNGDASKPAATAPSMPQRAAEAGVYGSGPNAPQPRQVQGAAKTAPPSAQAPAKAAAAAEQAPKSAPSAAVAKAQEAPLDVAALKERLRETKAIGVFTKLALKNQVDALLQQFRTHYLNGQKTAPAALRQQYDMLVLKVLALLQDTDPSLAKSIAGSREAIWGILADPVKFNAAS